jgi:hypothetical protein
LTLEEEESRLLATDQQKAMKDIKNVEENK